MVAFPYDEFNILFPIFTKTGSKYTEDDIQVAGYEALRHIGPSCRGMPMENPEDRKYALFLMAAHILVLNKQTEPSTEDGSGSAGGVAFKSTIGSVSIEKSKPNSFSVEDYGYWLSQTEYGRRLLAFLDTQIGAGIFLNTSTDSVRDLI